MILRAMSPRAARRSPSSLPASPGYTATKPTGTAAFGGYKDWFIKEYDRPGFTIEIGLGQNPIGFDQLEQVLGENICVMMYGAANA